MRNIIVAGCSAGGYFDCHVLLPQMRLTESAVLLAPHIDGDRILHSLETQGMSVGYASEGEKIERGRVYLIKPLDVEPTKDATVPRFRRSDTRHLEEADYGSVDRIMRRASVNYGDQVIGIILSGTLKDGSQGSKAVKKGGGKVLVHAPEKDESPFWYHGEMPLSAMRNTEVDFHGNLKTLADVVNDIL